ncbi:MAG: outer membrane beta-barrel protein [Candidatus Rokuibacteriota bacterium]
MRAFAWWVARRPWTPLLAAGWLTLVLPLVAAAEPYVGLYAGGAFVNEQDLDSEIDLGPPFSLSVADGTIKDIELDPGFLFGAKVGYFFDPPILGGHFGVELDVHRFENKIGSQTAEFSGTQLGAPFDGPTELEGGEIEVLAIGLNALYRYPLLTSPALPRGRLQPYVGIGAGAFIATLKTRTTPLDVNRDLEDTDVQPGFQLVVGNRVFLTRNIALFVEYKYMHTAEFEFRFREEGTFMGVPVTYTSRDRATLSGNQVYGGIAFHW